MPWDRLKQVIPDLDTQEIPEINSSLYEKQEIPLVSINPELGQARRDALVNHLKSIGSGIKDLASNPKDIATSAYKMGFYPFSQLGQSDYTNSSGLDIIDPSQTAAVPLSFKKLLQKPTQSNIREASDIIERGFSNKFIEEIRLKNALKEKLQKFQSEGPGNQLENFQNASDILPLYDKGIALLRSDATPNEISFSLATPNEVIPDWIDINRDMAGAPSIKLLRDLPERLKGQGLAAQSYTQIAKDLGRLRSDLAGNTSPNIKKAFWEQFSEPFVDINTPYKQRFQTMVNKPPRIDEEMGLYKDAADQWGKIINPQEKDLKEMNSLLYQAEHKAGKDRKANQDRLEKELGVLSQDEYDRMLREEISRLRSENKRVESLQGATMPINTIVDKIKSTFPINPKGKWLLTRSDFEEMYNYFLKNPWEYPNLSDPEVKSLIMHNIDNQLPRSKSIQFRKVINKFGTLR